MAAKIQHCWEIIPNAFPSGLPTPFSIITFTKNFYYEKTFFFVFYAIADYFKNGSTT